MITAIVTKNIVLAVHGQDISDALSSLNYVNQQSFFSNQHLQRKHQVLPSKLGSEISSNFPYTTSMQERHTSHPIIGFDSRQSSPHLRKLMRKSAEFVPFKLIEQYNMYTIMHL